MNTKQLLPIFIIISLFSIPSFAAESWHAVKVLMAGKIGSATYLRLQHIASDNSDFTNRMFVADESMTTEALAIAMAAIASNKQISIRSDFAERPSTEHPVITAIFLTNQPVQ
ncbi:MAG: hypothetical protein MJK04_08405, partial [Psychrosphaera sp.]|nr:hypothetical protein [Psychrosphaera sp.]